MKIHKNARDILPDRLLRELQEYISGETLYIFQSTGKETLGRNVRGAKLLQTALCRDTQNSIFIAFQNGRCENAVVASPYI